MTFFSSGVVSNIGSTLTMILISILKDGTRLDFTTEKDERLFNLLELSKGPIGTQQRILHVWMSSLPNIRHNFIESRAIYAKHSTSTEVLLNIHGPSKSPAYYWVWPDKKESYPKLFEFPSRILADLCFVGETNGGIGHPARNERRLSQALTYWNRCSHTAKKLSRDTPKLVIVATIVSNWEWTKRACAI
jgi:hypothetical protein